MAQAKSKNKPAASVRQSASQATHAAESDKKEARMALDKRNYLYMLTGFAIIVLGFVLMSGGGSENPATEFNYDMFSFRRITLAPILVLGGFAFEIFAIMHKPKG